MGRINSSIGLSTGINIEETVNKLIELAAQPRDRAEARQKSIGTTQAAITDLTALTLGVQLAARRFKNTALFTKAQITSSSSILTATASGNVAAGNYQFTAVRRSQNAHLFSNGFAATDQPLGAGTFSFRFGGAITQAVALADLNGGEGVARGKIRITDRGGAVAVIDLRYAQTIDDVVNAINNSDDIEIEASTQGDRLKLTDLSGGSGNLKVQEVSGGSTAADLGLSAINVAADSALGSDILRLHEDLAIRQLNDGAGVSFRTGLADLNVSLRDGTSLAIDFRRVARPASAAIGITTSANGLNAQIKLTADTVGGDYDGVQLQFIDSGNVSQGGEVASYDAQNKILTVDIDAGATTADDVIAAINNTPATSSLFTAARATGGNGSGFVDLGDTATTSGGAAIAATNEQTLGDLIETINAVNPAKLQAALSADGDRIVLTDLSTNNGGTFAVTNTVGGTLAEDLELTGAASGGTLTSGRLLGGLQSPLLRTLNGGQGLGTLGQIDLTDRLGATASINLAAAETLDDIITAINGSGLGLRAEINAARNGLQIVDKTNGTASNLIIADGDGTNSASKLGIVANVASGTFSGTTLSRQIVGEQTLLSEYNAGRGVALGSFIITNSNGVSGAVNLSALKATTIGDVIDAINNLSIGVKARINDTGDGIAIIDQANGSQRLKVENVGTGKAATDLRLTTASVDATVGGNPAQVVSGSTAYSVTLDADDTLADLVTKLNDLNAGVRASIVSDGSGTLKHHLSLVSSINGKAGDLIVDASALGFKFQTLTTAQDALLSIGGDGSGGRLITSSNSFFKDVVEGLDVTLTGTSTETINVSATPTSSDIESTIQTFVDQYNKLRDKIASYTFFNESDSTRGVLFGSAEVLRIESELSRAITNRYFTDGTVRSFNELGISADDKGKLTFDRTRLQARFASDPEGLKAFFTDEDKGFAKKVDDVLERLVGRDNSALVNRARVLQNQLEDAADRVSFLTASLDRQRERLLTQFYNMELAISKIKSNLSSIESIQFIGPIQSSS